MRHGLGARGKLARGAIVVALLSLELVTVGSPSPSIAGRPQSRKYPGAAPCSTTLRRCINRLPAGSEIRIATNDRIEEEFEISKSLTLKAATGFNPTLILEDTHQLEISREPGTGPLNVSLQGLSFEETEVEVDLRTGQNHTFKMTNSTIDLTGTSGDGLNLYLARPTSALIRRNVITSPGDVMSVRSALAEGASDVTIEGNVLSSVSPEDSASGMFIYSENKGDFVANIYSNLIYGVAGCNCGGAAGIDFRTIGEVNATANIVHNTLDDLQSASDGIQLVRYQAATGLMTANIFNNIVTRATQRGIDLPEGTVSTTVRNGYNNFYDNADPNDFDEFPAGPNTISVDPQYTDPGLRMYRPLAGSPMEDVGLVCSPGGLSRIDVEGHYRIDGHTTSLGAYETNMSVPPTGEYIFGTMGPDELSGGVGQDVLCGLDGSDTLLALQNNDVAFGGNQNDVVKGGSGDDFVSGDKGSDEIYGGTGSDYMYGGEGNDVDVLYGVDGVEGNDTLDGGLGFDSCNPDPNDTLVSC